MSDKDHVTVEYIEDAIKELEEKTETKPRKHKKVKFEDSDSEDEDSTENDNATVTILFSVFSTIKRYIIELFITSILFIMFVKIDTNKYINNIIPLNEYHNSELISTVIVGTLFAVTLLLVKMSVLFTVV